LSDILVSYNYLIHSDSNLDAEDDNEGRPPAAEPRRRRKRENEPPRQREQVHEHAHAARVALVAHGFLELVGPCHADEGELVRVEAHAHAERLAAAARLVVTQDDDGRERARGAAVAVCREDRAALSVLEDDLEVLVALVVVVVDDAHGDGALEDAVGELYELALQRQVIVRRDGLAVLRRDGAAHDALRAVDAAERDERLLARLAHLDVVLGEGEDAGRRLGDDPHGALRDDAELVARRGRRDGDVEDGAAARLLLVLGQHLQTERRRLLAGAEGDGALGGDGVGRLVSRGEGARARVPDARGRQHVSIAEDFDLGPAIVVRHRDLRRAELEDAVLHGLGREAADDLVDEELLEALRLGLARGGARGGARRVDAVRGARELRRLLGRTVAAELHEALTRDADAAAAGAAARQRAAREEALVGPVGELQQDREEKERRHALGDRHDVGRRDDEDEVQPHVREYRKGRCDVEDAAVLDVAAVAARDGDDAHGGDDHQVEGGRAHDRRRAERASVKVVAKDLNDREQDLRRRRAERHQREVGDGGVPHAHGDVACHAVGQRDLLRLLLRRDLLDGLHEEVGADRDADEGPEQQAQKGQRHRRRLHRAADEQAVGARVVQAAVDWPLAVAAEEPREHPGSFHRGDRGRDVFDRRIDSERFLELGDAILGCVRLMLARHVASRVREREPNEHEDRAARRSHARAAHPARVIVVVEDRAAANDGRFGNSVRGSGGTPGLVQGGGRCG